MDLQVINDLFNYSYWAFDQIWPSIIQLDDEQFTTEVPYSLGSIRNQIIHLISGHHRWVQRLQGIEPSPHLIFEDFPTKVLVKDAWDSAKDNMLAYISSITNQSLMDSVIYKIPSRSIDSHNTRLEILLHLVNHSTDHRSQILSILSNNFGIETPEHDYILYLWSKEKDI